MNGEARAVLRDVIVLFALTGLGGFIVGLSGAQGEEVFVAVGISNMLFSVVGFCISGCRATGKRFRHLRNVAVVAWLASLMNPVLFEEITFDMWFVGLIPLAVCMGLGGALSYLFVPSSKDSSSPLAGGARQAQNFPIGQWVTTIIMGVIANLIFLALQSVAR